MTFKSIFQLFLAVCATGAAANADTIAVFNFDGDSIGTATTFTDTANGIGATFSSNADPGGFVVYQNMGMFETLTGNVLGDPGPAGQDNLTLNVSFSSDLNAVTLDFATSDFATPSPLTLQAYQGSTLVGSTTQTGMFLSGFEFPEGEIALDGPTFNSLVISSTATDFAVDNIAVNAVPEPAPLAYFLVGLLSIALGSRRRKTRSSAGSIN